MDPVKASIISAIVAGLGFLFAWFGIQQVSITQLGSVLTSVLKILADKSKNAQEKMLEIEVLLKKECELLNISWAQLNCEGDTALKSVTEVVNIAATLPGKLGEVANVAATALNALQPPTEPPK